MAYFVQYIQICAVLSRARAGVLAAVLWALCAASAYSASGLSFEHKDWQLVCDNTGTCRAAGYQSIEKSGASEPASMLLTRAAGPLARVRIQVKLATEGKAKPGDMVSMQLGDRGFAKLPLMRDWASVQVQAMLPSLLAAEEAEFTYNRAQRWTISLQGLKAVLLKMDEFQGRAGTQGALVARGSKAEDDVPHPLPPQQISMAAVPKAQAGDEALVAEIAPLLGSVNCTNSSLDYEIARLSDSKLLLWSVGCHSGAYNNSNTYWLVNDSPPYNPQRLPIEDGNSYQDGLISGVQKGRGIADCMFQAEWRWNGLEFILSKELTTGMCRGFPGGAWFLPTVVSITKKP
jgi:Protein of unknown function (DUF1176)